MTLYRESYAHKLVRILNFAKTTPEPEKAKWVPPVGVEPDRGRLAGFIPQRETEIGLRRSDKVGSK